MRCLSTNHQHESTNSVMRWLSTNAKRAERGKRQAAAKAYEAQNGRMRAEKRRNLRRRRTKLHKFSVEEAFNAIPKGKIDQRPINFSPFVIAPRYVDTVDKHKEFDQYSNQIRVRGLKAEQRRKRSRSTLMMMSAFGKVAAKARGPYRCARGRDDRVLVLRAFVCKQSHMSEYCRCWRAESARGHH